MTETRSAPGLTVGSLLGMPLGAAAPLARSTPAAAATPTVAPGPGRPLPPSENEGPDWVVASGEVRARGDQPSFRADGAEALDYNNPFNLTMERVWFDGKIVYAVDMGEVDVDADRVKVAQEYQIVYDVALDAAGKLARSPEMVPGQYNIYDSVPGMDKYSPIWQFNYVVVPRDYEINSLRSESGCLTSGYRILHSSVFEN
jgi:hypothetical protein